ncbi:hypothetical protein HPB50_028836 [Hyalomma asiaticum]|nr:hypothetical protein HPB50_028836 [Hyalomma asiaticum]
MNKSEADAIALALTDIRDLKESYEALLSKHATAEVEIKPLKRKVEMLEKANAVRLADGAGADADALRVEKSSTGLDGPRRRTTWRKKKQRCSKVWRKEEGAHDSSVFASHQAISADDDPAAVQRSRRRF